MNGSLEHSSVVPFLQRKGNANAMENHIYTKKQREYIDLRASGLSSAKVCKQLGLAESTPCRWHTKFGDEWDEVIAQRAKELLHSQVPNVMKELIHEARYGKRANKIQAIRMILEMTRLYAEKSEVESTNRTTLAFEKLTDEELDAELAKAVEKVKK